MDAPLNFNKNRDALLERESFDAREDSFAVSEILDQLTGFVRRQFPIFVFFVACSLALGIVYLFTTPPSYTSHAMLLIDSSKLRALQQQQVAIGDVPIDTAQVETQVEILKSENIGSSVIKEMKLIDDSEFVGSGWGLLGGILGYFEPSVPPSEASTARKALDTFMKRRTIARVGRTYVLDISFTSLSAVRSAAVSNAIADAYIVDQLEAKYQATRRASVWLQDRIKELRQQASDADRAVLSYKEKNNIVAVGGNSGGNGPRLLGEQQLEELNSQLGTARAAAEESKARLDRINDVMKRDVPDATVTDSLHSEVINRLRNNYLDISAKEAIWSARYGASHLATVNLRTQMTELRRAILDELGRIAQSYKSDYEIAKSRIDGLERNLEGLVANSQSVNRDRLGLRDLESTAQVYHTLYDNFLQRYMEAIQQQSFPITEARVISAAAIPQQKSAPITFNVLGVAGVIGVILSFVAAVMREAVDQVFRTTRQVETVLNANCLVVLPLLSSAAKSLKERGSKLTPMAARAGPQSRVSPLGTGYSMVDLPSPVERSDHEVEIINLSRVSQLPQFELGRNQSRKDGAVLPEIVAAKNFVTSKKGFMRHVVDEPLSAFAEAFRSIKIAADIAGSRKNNQVLGITSTVAGEGKSMISSNLAQLIAHSGKKVVLVDGDLRNPTLTRALAPHSKVGLLEVLNNHSTLSDVVCLDELTHLNFIPAVVPQRLLHTNEILASESFKNFIERLRKIYEYVIIDFPPVAPIVDVRATTDVVDSYIYVVEWGKTRKNLVQHQLRSAPEIYNRLLGVVLNKADVNVLQRYEAYYGRYYYKRHYGNQYPHSA
jgi:polysaccharide biosynthesis transport protein